MSLGSMQREREVLAMPCQTNSESLGESPAEPGVEMPQLPLGPWHQHSFGFPVPILQKARRRVLVK